MCLQRFARFPRSRECHRDVDRVSLDRRRRFLREMAARAVGSGSGGGFSMERILVVDDDANERLLIREELAREGYEVVVAASGREAVDLARERLPDLVVMDIELPEMDGVEALGRILVLDRVPSILYTGYATHKTNFQTWAADSFVMKSSDLEPLKQEIRSLLSRQPS
jgi:two-component system, response regulator, stage 0 sporulation protein F